MGDIAELPAVRTDSDVLARWRLMMGPGGFSRRSLWIIWFDCDGAQLPLVVPVDDISPAPDDEILEGIVRLAGRVLHERAPDGSVSFAFSRPGHGEAREGDRQWARGLVAHSRAQGLRLRCTHLAAHDSVHQFALDDLL